MCKLINFTSIIIIGSIGYYIYAANHESQEHNEEHVHDHDHEHEHAEEHNYEDDHNHDHSHDTNDTVTTNPPTTISPIVLWENNEEIKILRNYLRIQTAHPDIIYSNNYCC